MFIQSPMPLKGIPRPSAARPVLRGLLTRPRSLRTHMAAIILLALALPIGVQLLGGIALLDSFNTHHRNALQYAADRLAAVVEVQIHNEVTAATALGSAIAVGNEGEVATQTRALASELHGTPRMWTRDGTLQTPLRGGAAMPPPANRLAEFARRAAAEGRAALASGTGPVPTVSVFATAGDKGVVEVVYPTTQLTQLLTQPSSPEIASSCLVGETGVVIAGLVGTPCAVGTPLPPWLRAELDHASYGVVEGDRLPGRIALAAFAAPPLIATWHVLLMEPRNAYGLQGPATVLVGVASLSVVLAILTAMAAGAFLSGPLRSLTLAAQGVAAGADSLGDVPTSPVVEFNDLRVSVARADAVLRRRAAAERLALREARTGHELLASVVNATADLIYVKNLELRFVLANRAALIADWVDRDEWQVLGRREADIIDPEKAARLEALDRQVLQTGELRTGHIEWVHGDGSAHVYAMTKTPWRDAAGAIAGVVTVVHDITDQHAAEQRLAGIQGELLRATRLSAMGEMASGLAHELNQPLAAATNFLNATVHLLARDDPSVLPMVRSAVSDAAEQTLRAGAIVRRLRDFVGRGEADLNIENVGEIVSEIRRVACADGAIDDRQLVVKPGSPDVIALVERTQIQQVLLNLIKNASEAIGGAPGGRIALSWRETTDGVEISVADNGPGLAQEVRGRLFQPFTSTKAFGMGIGLAICRTIVEGHGGRLSVEDNPGGGAVFRIILPPAMNDSFDTQEQHS